MFDYDATTPLADTTHDTHERGPALVEELSYAGANRARVTATLVSPRAGTRPAGIVFLHWGFGSRRSFFSEALSYAGGGAMSLLVDAPGMGGRGRGLPRLGDAAVARAFVRQSVVDLRRGLDLLVARGADGERLAFVGHSLGATLGGPFVGAEPRLRAAVLMAGFGDVSTGGWRLRPNAAYRDALAPLDGTTWIARSRAALPFQFAMRDGFVTRAAAERFVAAAPPDKRVAWYRRDHRLGPDALAERAAWLVQTLALDGPRGDEWLAGVALPRAEVAKYLAAKPLVAALSFLLGERRPA